MRKRKDKNPKPDQKTTPNPEKLAKISSTQHGWITRSASGLRRWIGGITSVTSGWLSRTISKSAVPIFNIPAATMRFCWSIYLQVSVNGEFRKILYYLILAVIAYLVSDSLEKLISRGGHTIFAEWKATLAKDIIFWAVSLSIFIVHLIRFRIKYLTRISQVVLTMIVIVFYLKFRLTPYSINFVKTLWIPSLTYTDLVIAGITAGLILQIITRIRLRRKRLTVESKDQKGDFNPKITEGEDQLNRKGFVRLICEEISRKGKNSAESIAIVGNWGEGKTTILNFVKERLSQEEEVIVMEFNPWIVPDKANYPQEFLRSLQAAVAPFSGLAKESVQAFEEVLQQDVAKGMVSSLGTWIKDQLLPKWTRKSVQDDLVGAVSKLDKKIVVLIDDLDRLSADELREAFRIIRNIGCIHGVQLISAFDRNHLFEVMEGGEYGDAAAYLGKIFPIQRDVPKVPEWMIKDRILSYFRSGEDKFKEHFPKIEKLLSTKRIPFDEEYVELPYSLTMRDANMFAESLAGHLSEIGEDICLKDLVIITLIKVKYPRLYHLIKEKQILNEAFAPEGLGIVLVRNVQYDADVLANRYKVGLEGFRLLDQLFSTSEKTIDGSNPLFMRIRHTRGFQIFFFTDNVPYVKKSEVMSMIKSPFENLIKNMNESKVSEFQGEWNQMLDIIESNLREEDVLNYCWVSICCGRNPFESIPKKFARSYSLFGGKKGTLISCLPSFVGLSEEITSNVVGSLNRINREIIYGRLNESFGSRREILSILHELLAFLIKDAPQNYGLIISTFYRCIHEIDPPDGGFIFLTKESCEMLKEYLVENSEGYIQNFFSFQPAWVGPEVRHNAYHYNIFSEKEDQQAFLELVSKFEKEQGKTKIKQFLDQCEKGFGKNVLRFESAEAIRTFFKGTIYEKETEEVVFKRS